MPTATIRPRTRNRRLAGFALLLLAGTLTTVVVAWVLALLIEPRSGRSESAEETVGNGYWSVQRWTQPGVVAVESARGPAHRRSWGTEQLIGPPDTQGSGDIPTAWASSSQDGQDEWLTLDYEKPVVPAFVHVVETYNPGALSKVSVLAPDGKEITAWEGDDPALPGSNRGVSKIPIKVDVPVKRVKLYLASPQVPGWNEIDAVALIDGQGGVQWAVAAQASSTYASYRSGSGMSGTTGSPDELVPRWSSITNPNRGSAGSSAGNKTVFSAGFGWPLPAMCYESDSVPAAPTPVFMSGYATYRVGPPPTPTTRRLPYRPIWTGLLLNTLLYSVALWLLYRVPRLVLARPLRIGRELLRLRRGHCLSCGYDLRYDFINGCPECGWHRKEIETADTDLSRTHYDHVRDHRN